MGVNLRLCPTVALVLVVACSGLITSGLAGKITGTAFPFEGCVSDPRQSRYTATLAQNDWNERTRTTRVCFQLNLKPEDECKAKGNRCCNTEFVKLKLYPQNNCRQSVSNIRINDGKFEYKAISYEGSGSKFIFKVVRLPFKMSNANDSQICMTLGGPCRTMYNFANKATRDKGMLEFALYDKKYLDGPSKKTMKRPYECCPTGVFVFNETAAAAAGYTP